jgi:hypothetical protein
VTRGLGGSGRLETAGTAPARAAKNADGDQRKERRHRQHLHQRTSGAAPRVARRLRGHGPLQARHEGRPVARRRRRDLRTRGQGRLDETQIVERGGIHGTFLEVRSTAALGRRSSP